MDQISFKGRHFDRSVILLCVRRYLAYSLTLRDLEEMMAERGISVDPATLRRWVIRYSPELLERFNLRKRAIGCKWHMDETYIRVHGQRTYLYRAINSLGDTVEFFFSEERDLAAAKRFLTQAFYSHGRPEGKSSTAATRILTPSISRHREPASWSLTAPVEADPDPPQQISEQPD